MWLSFSPSTSILLAGGVSASFVLSLYVWRHSLTQDRDRPEVIRQRIASTGVITILCVPLLILLASAVPSTHASLKEGPPISEWIGFPLDPSAFPVAIVLPLILTASLFLGPLVVMLLTSWRSDVGDTIEPSIGKTIEYVTSSFHDLWTEDERWKSVRNLVAAPIAEEVVFRGAVLCVLVSGGWSFGECVLLSPVLFGLAHLHHLINLVRARGASMKQGIIMVTFQLGYTTIFGAFASFVFLRTGHLLSAIVVHAFCNLMGFPELRFLSPSHFLHSKRIAIIIVFLTGIVIFSLSLWPLTDPKLYISTDGRGPWLLQYQQLAQAYN